MRDERVAGYAGAAAVVGGVAWVAGCLMQAHQPRGCVGEECNILPMRETPAGVVVAMAVAAVLLLVSGIGLLTLIRRSGGLPRTGVVGAILCVAGLGVLAAAGVVQALFFDGDFPLMPAFVVPGVLAGAVGLLLVAWTVLRSRVLPRWSGVSLMAGAVLLLGANEQNSSVLLAAPFGLAWVATGVALWGGRGGHPSPVQGVGGPRTTVEG